MEKSFEQKNQAQQETSLNEQREQTERPKYQSKLVRQNYVYTGNTARDCRHKRKEASAYLSVPYQKQVTEDN